MQGLIARDMRLKDFVNEELAKIVDEVHVRRRPFRNRLNVGIGGRVCHLIGCVRLFRRQHLEE